ncbi:MAG: hypothetical protein QT05_C0001G0027 [archaeon GW2011_AR13]|nr:MAG: hypothetical protein QT05_C0001G0027 [archaeon GW2011_AR13]
MEKIKYKENRNNNIILIAILFVFLFFWYSQLTNTLGGPIYFIRDSFSNLGNIFSEDVQVEGNFPLQNILLFSKKVDYGKEWAEYNNQIKKKYNNFSEDIFYPKERISNTQQSIIFSKGLESNIYPNLNVPFLRTLFEFMGRLFIVLGVLFFFIFSRKIKDKILLNIIGLCFLGFLIIFTFLPFFSLYYDLPRFYQQFLIILSIFSPIGFFILINPIFKNKSYILVALFFIIYSILSLGLIYQLTGGTSAAMRLNNIGFEYDTRYNHGSELTSAFWIIQKDYSKDLYLDNHALLRFFLVENSIPKKNIFQDVIPTIINKNAYVYSGYTNAIKEVTIKTYNRLPLSFNFPTEFLDDNKNKVYSTGESEIFK